MKIYVAGKWENKELINRWYKLLENDGHTITYKWTEHGSEVSLAEEAMNDFRGVMTADVLVAVLVNESKLRHASPNRYVEIGMALGREIPVIIMGAPRKDFIFRHLQHVFVDPYSSMDRCLKILSDLDQPYLK